MDPKFYSDFLSLIQKLSDKIDSIDKKLGPINKLDSGEKNKLKLIYDEFKKSFAGYQFKVSLSPDAVKQLSEVKGSSTVVTQEGGPGTEDGPRKIGKEPQPVTLMGIDKKVIEDLKKLLTPEKEESPLKIAKASLWGLITMVVGFIIGVLEFVMEKAQEIYRFLRSLFAEEGIFGKMWAYVKTLFSEEGPIMGFWKWVKSLFAEDAIFGKMWNWFKGLFEEEGVFGKVFSRIKALFGEDTLLGGLIQKVKAFFSEEGPLGNVFKKMGAVFEEEGFIGKTLSWLKGLFAEESAFGKLFTSIKGLFAEEGILMGGLRAIKGFFGSIGEGIGTIAKLVEPLLGLLEPILAPIRMIAGTVGKLLSKIFFPLMIIFTAIDAVVQTYESIKEQGLSFKAIFDGVMGAIASFFTFGLLNFKDIKKLTDGIVEKFKNGDYLGMITDALLLIPNVLINGVGKLIGTVAGWLGFDNFAEKTKKFFDNFNLSKKLEEIGTTLGEKVYDFVVSIKDKIANSISFVFEKLGNMFEFIKNFLTLKNILKLSPGYWLAKKIVDNVPGIPQSVKDLFSDTPSIEKAPAPEVAVAPKPKATTAEFQTKPNETLPEISKQSELKTNKTEVNKVTPPPSDKSEVYLKQIAKQVEIANQQDKAKSVNNNSVTNQNTVINSNSDTNGINNWRRNVYAGSAA